MSIEIRVSKLGDFAHLFDTETGYESVSFKASYFHVSDDVEGNRIFIQGGIETPVSSLDLNPEPLGSWGNYVDATAGYLEIAHNTLTEGWSAKDFLETDVLKRIYNVYRVAQTLANHPQTKEEGNLQFGPAFRHIRKIREEADAIHRLSTIRNVPAIPDAIATWARLEFEYYQEIVLELNHRFDLELVA